MASAHTLKEKTWLDKDGKLAKKGKEAFLLGPKGAKIPYAQAEALGLHKRPDGEEGDEEALGYHILKKRTWLDKSGEKVVEGKGAAILLGNEGAHIDLEKARKLGLAAKPKKKKDDDPKDPEGEGKGKGPEGDKNRKTKTDDK